MMQVYFVDLKMQFFEDRCVLLKKLEQGMLEFVYCDIQCGIVEFGKEKGNIFKDE